MESKNPANVMNVSSIEYGRHHRYILWALIGLKSTSDKRCSICASESLELLSPSRTADVSVAKGTYMCPFDFVHTVGHVEDPYVGPKEFCQVSRSSVHRSRAWLMHRSLLQRSPTDT
jgi:hypothetical protein